MPSVREKSASLWQREQWWNDFRSHSWDGSKHTPHLSRKQGNNHASCIFSGMLLRPGGKI